MNRVPGTNKFDQTRYCQFKDGTQKWFDHWNRLHRRDGPAVILADGTEHWMIHGKHHRTDGPAIIYPDGRTRWFINDIRIESKNRFRLRTNISNEDLAILILKYGDIT